MTLYSPSTILDAFVYSGATCMVFLRNTSMVRYKGIYKAPDVGAQHVVPYSALSPHVRPLPPRAPVPTPSPPLTSDPPPTPSRSKTASRR